MPVLWTIMTTTLLLLAATYYLLAPLAVARSEAMRTKPLGLIIAARLVEEQKNKHSGSSRENASILLGFAFVLAFVLLVGVRSPGSFLLLITFGNIGFALMGLYLLVQNKLVLLLPLLLLPIAFAHQGVLTAPLYNLVTVLTLLGGFYVVYACCSQRSIKIFLVALTAFDVFMISSGTLAQVIPLSLGAAPPRIFGFLYLPHGVRIGVGDFFGLAILTSLVIREHSRRHLVFAAYALAFAVGVVLAVSGTLTLFPATLPLLPALLCHELTRRRATPVPSTAPCA